MLFLRCVVAGALALLLHAPLAWGAWPQAGHKFVGGVRAVLPDGSGGAFVATSDFSEVIVERFAEDGSHVEILRVPTSPQWAIDSDGSGGFFLAWRADVESNGRVNLSRYSDLGEQIWTMPVSAMQAGNEHLLGIVAGQGGDVYVGTYYNYDESVLRLMRINSEGLRPVDWPSEDLVVDGHGFDAWSFERDGSGGVVVGFSTWGTDIHRVLAQRFDSTGSRLWSWDASSDQLSGIRTHPDGTGGTFIAWVTPEPAVQVTHLAIGGETVAGWPDSGLRISCAGRVDLPEVSLCSDSSGGIFLAWAQNLDYNDVHALHLNGDGSVAPGWARCGNLVSRGEGNQDEAVCVPDGAGGVLIAWQDWRHYGNGDGGGSIEPFAVRLAADGTLVTGWSAGGMSIASPTVAFDLIVIPDGTGGALVGWSFTYNFVGGLQHIRGDAVYGPRLTETGRPSIRMSTPWPNPFESRLEFVIDLPRAERLSVAVRDVMGRRVATLKHPDIQHAGPNTIRWRGDDEGGSPARPGVYFIEVHSESGVRSKRVVKIQ